MIEFFNSLPDWFQWHLVVGLVVFLFILKSFAYRMANSTSGYASGHRVSGFKDMGINPTLGDYIGCILWSPPMIVGWPIVLFFYIVGTNHPDNQG